MSQSMRITKEIGEPVACREYGLTPVGRTAGMKLKSE